MLCVIQLSDLHVKNAHWEGCTRGPAVAAAAASLAAQIDHFLVLFTGDIAWSGKSEQYLPARSFLDDITNALRQSHSSARIDVLVLPGNHDCDVEKEPQTRSLALSLLRKSEIQPTKDVIETGASVQAAFDAFASSINPSPSVSAAEGMLKIYRLESASCRLALLSLNSAWSSQKDEEKGTLLFPRFSVPEVEADITIAAIHHPISWFRWDTAKDLQRNLEGAANLIFTGHEHLPDSYEITRSRDRVRFVEGGVLQGEHPKQSSFNLVLLDSANKKIRIIQARLDGGMYHLNTAQTEWKELPAKGRVGRKQKFPLNPDFQSKLLDLGLPITHAHRAKIELMDLFVAPCLRIIKSKGDAIDRKAIVDSDSTLNTLLDQDKSVITGQDASGKTGLARALFIQAVEGGVAPLLIAADVLQPRHANNIERFISDTFAEQYDGAFLDQYLALSRGQRLVVVDDFHLCELTGSDRATLLNGLAAFGRLVVIGGESLRLEELVHSPENFGDLISFKQFEIMPFGHLLRSRLIEKWVDLSADSGRSTDERAHSLSVTRNQVNTVIGKNLVPAHPGFLLLILQQVEASTPINTSAGSYGYFYEALITYALATRSKGIDVDTLYTYLSELAFYLFKNKARTIPHNELGRLHATYCDNYQRNLALDEIIDTLKASELIERRTDGIEFKYKYTYYYFAARHLHNNPSEIPEAVKDLVSKLYREEESNIYLFLSYLSRDPIILNSILETAKGLFSGLPPCNFDGHLDFLARLSGGEDNRLELPARSADQNREEVFRKLDHYSPPDEEQGDFDEEIDLVNQLNVAMKTLQILGQAMKNAPGSLRGATKEQIANEAYSLGLRTLSAMLDLIREFSEDGLPDMAKGILSANGNDNPSDEQRAKAMEQARKLTAALGQLLAISMLKKVSQSVGLEKLDQTFNRVASSRGDTATKLIDACIRLEHYKKIPEATLFSLESEIRKTVFPKRFLRWLVFERLYMMPCDYRTRQRLCEKFDINTKGTRSGFPKLQSGSDVN